MPGASSPWMREQPGTPRLLRHAVERGRQLLLPDDVLVEARRAAAGEDRAEDVERVVVRVDPVRDVVDRVEADGPREAIVQDLPLLLLLRRLGHVRLGRRRLRGDGLEVLPHLREALLRLHVADDRHDGVVRRVVGPEERRDVLDRGGAQVRHRPDHRVLVVEVLVRQVLQHLVGLAVGLVVDALAPLFLHRVDLVLQVFLGDARREGAHAVRLEEEAEIELVGGKRLEVVGAVLVRGPVHVPAVVVDEHEVLAAADVLRPLEHHVFEEVRESGASLPLVARPHVVGHARSE